MRLLPPFVALVVMAILASGGVGATVRDPWLVRAANVFKPQPPEKLSYCMLHHGRWTKAKAGWVTECSGADLVRRLWGKS